jgi:hypothetical protein
LGAKKVAIKTKLQPLALIMSDKRLKSPYSVRQKRGSGKRKEKERKKEMMR